MFELIGLNGRIIDRDNTTIYIIMEYCQGGDLADLIKSRRKTRFGLIAFSVEQPSLVITGCT
jgi:serine/threonine protein kinase